MNKKSISYEDKEVFIGIDVHRKKYAISVVVEGEHVDNFVYSGTMADFVKILVSRYSKRGSKVRCCYEAGFSGFNLYRELENCGFKCSVVHAGAVAVSNSKIKTDRRDAKSMSYQLYSGRLKGIYIPSPEEEDERRLCRLRRNLVKDRTRNRIRLRMLFHYYGILPFNVGSYLSYVRAQKIFVSNADKFGSGFREELGKYLDSWDFISKQIKEVEKQIKEQASNSDIDKYYLSVPGIGPLTARVLAGELGDMSRFTNVKGLYSYLGLTPSEYSSGEHRKLGRISRQGKPILRTMLVQAAWGAIRKDQSLNDFYQKLKVKKGSKRAIIALARKLAGIARSCVRDKQLYEMNIDENEKEQMAA